LGGIVPVVFKTPEGFKEAMIYGCSGMAILLSGMALSVTKENERRDIRIMWRAHCETLDFIRDRFRGR
jgi:hypothetical protein